MSKIFKSYKQMKKAAEIFRKNLLEELSSGNPESTVKMDISDDIIFVNAGLFCVGFTQEVIVLEFFPQYLETGLEYSLGTMLTLSNLPKELHSSIILTRTGLIFDSMGGLVLTMDEGEFKEYSGCHCDNCFKSKVEELTEIVQSEDYEGDEGTPVIPSMNYMPSVNKKR